MAGRALLAGYHRYTPPLTVSQRVFIENIWSSFNNRIDVFFRWQCNMLKLASLPLHVLWYNCWQWLPYRSTMEASLHQTHHNSDSKHRNGYHNDLFPAKVFRTWKCIKLFMDSCNSFRPYIPRCTVTMTSKLYRHMCKLSIKLVYIGYEMSHFNIYITSIDLLTRKCVTLMFFLAYCIIVWPQSRAMLLCCLSSV